MTTDASLPGGATTAFVRGIERRATLFAELQCGDAQRGDGAVAATVRAFVGSAAAAPMPTWPGLTSSSVIFRWAMVVVVAVMPPDYDALSLRPSAKAKARQGR